MSRLRGHPMLFAVSVLVAIVLGLVPLPGLAGALKPYWLGLVLVYWMLEEPRRAGLGLAFVLGLLADLVYGTLFGEQALRLVMLAFIVQRFRPRLRFFPLWQQATAVAALMLNDRVIAFAVRLFSGEGAPPLDFWLSPITALLLWPWLFLLLDFQRMRGREREG
jgi:rod shape-determining protein MreD